MSLQDLFWILLGIAMVCCMAWATWAVLRPTSTLLKNRTASLSKRDYRAIGGFWVTLFVSLTFSTFWVLDLILPRRWGYHNEDGDWIPFSIFIAVIAALVGSSRILSRMDKLQMSPLKLEFYSTRLRPKEVTDCLAALRQVRPLFSRYAYFHVSRIVESNLRLPDCRKPIIELVKKDGNSPRSVILHEIVRVSLSLLETGPSTYRWRFNKDLNPEQFEIKATFDIALDELVKSGSIDESEAKRQRAKLAKPIARGG